MSVIIFHNPRCSKSRAAIAILKEKGIDFKVIKYLENPLTAIEITALIQELGIDARGLMRKGEKEYKEQGLDNSSLSEQELINAMVKAPKLIERPIVKSDKGAAIGRPVENILNIL